MTDTTIRFCLEVNARSYEIATEASATLLEVLRGPLNLTGTKSNCEQGECGVCTVLVDGAPVNACIALAAAIEGSVVTTIEGLATDGVPNPLQQAFLAHDAAQCGYCTPGMIMAAQGLLNDNRRPSTDDIRRGLEGNYCRCTGYVAIVEAVKHVAGAAGGPGCDFTCSGHEAEAPQEDQP